MKTKNSLFCLLLILLTSLSAQSFAQTDEPVTHSPSKWYMGMGWGLTFPVQDWIPDYPLGGQGLFFTGFKLDDSLSLQLSLNPIFYTGNGLSTLDNRVSLELRWRNNAEGVHPYVLAGPGFDIQVLSPSGYNTSTPTGVFGIGFDFDLRPGQRLFLESRYDVLFYNNLTQQDIPLTFGLNEDL
jgi:hypothetical protein